MNKSDNFDKVSDCLHSKEVLNTLGELQGELQDKIRGMIAGNIIGDILGFPLEGKSGNITPYPPLKLNNKCLTKINNKIWTDDTSMLIALGTSLLESNGLVNPTNERKHYVKWFYSGYYTPENKSFGYGNTTKNALVYEKAGTDRSSNGNGALMRSCIIVPYYLNKTDKALEEASANSCGVTHGHPVSIFTNIIYTFILKKILHNFTLIDSISMAEEKYSEMINDINEIFIQPVFYTTTAYCVTTLQTALWVNVESKSFSEAVAKAVNLGGDADTIGAITGAIAGAIYGFKSISKDYKRAVLEIINKFQALKIFFQGEKYD